MHKPYKRPTTTNSVFTPGQQLSNASYPRYQVIASATSSVTHNGTSGLTSVHNTAVNNNSTYNQSYVRSTVNRYNSNQTAIRYATEPPGPPLPPKGITNGHYTRSYSHPPDVNGNVAPAVPPKGLLRTNQVDHLLAKQTDRQLTIQEHREEATDQGRPLEFTDVNGNVNGGDDDQSSSEYSSLTYNVRRRMDQQQQYQPKVSTNNGAGASKLSALHRHFYQPHQQSSSSEKMRTPQLGTSVAVASAAACTVGRTATANSVPPPPSSSSLTDSRRQEMSFVEKLVSTQQRQLAAAAAQKPIATAFVENHQDDTDVECEEELLSCEESDPVSCSSHDSHHNHHYLQHKSSSSHQQNFMSASLCSTTSTTSSFCFEGIGNSSSQGSCTSSGSQTPRPGRKARTESSASCTTLSQESTKDWIDDEIADQPDLFMTSGSPPKEGGHHHQGGCAGPGAVSEMNGERSEQSILLDRHHFHLNFPQPVAAHMSASTSKSGTPMDDSITPTNPHPNPLRSANHELESLILQHSPKSDDHTSLPPLHNYSHHQHHNSSDDRSRSFSFNHANNQTSGNSTGTTPTNGPMSPGGPFASPRVANLKKRHSYTASSTGNHTVTSTTPSYAIFRRPRPLSFVETADGALGLDSPSLRAVSQDVIGIKTLLFRLQGVLQNVCAQMVPVTLYN